MRDPAAELTHAGISSLLNFSSSGPSEETLSSRAVEQCLLVVLIPFPSDSPLSIFPRARLPPCPLW